MPRTLTIAAVTMDGSPAPKSERLERAAALIAEAAQNDAQLVVLPEVFNTGYEYHENNYTLPESADGETITWMLEQAAMHNVHLAGSLLLRDGKDIFNSQMLVAPDGRRWRYDKNYPWLFERAYFRGGDEIMVAQTDIGKLGMMVCWDYAHPELWQRYAGKVDAMIVTSSPPKMNRFTLLMPDGSRVDSRALGPLVNQSYYGNDHPFGTDFDMQVRWLGVPAVNTGACGRFRSFVPTPRAALLGYTLLRPDLWRYLSQAHEMELIADYYDVTKVIDGEGRVLARSQGTEGVTLATVDMPDETPPAPTTEQPDIPYAVTTYFLTDVFGPSQVESTYREGVRQHWGQRMAPFQRTYRWHIIIGLGIVGLLATLLRFLGRLTGGRNDNKPLDV